MQKTTPRLKKTDSISSGNKRLEKLPEMQPKASTLQNILQFASTYRVEKVADNQFVELFLN
ncbi:MAG: hypothetical protein QM800_10770 [Paludibacter sp.]